MKAKRCLCVWIFYLIAFNAYILLFGHISHTYSRLIYMGSGLFSLIFTAIEILKPCVSDLHRAFLCLILSAMAANFAVMIVYYCLGINDYKLNLIIFNGIELLTACMVLISGNKRGLFKNE